MYGVSVTSQILAREKVKGREGSFRVEARYMEKYHV